MMVKQKNKAFGMWFTPGKGKKASLMWWITQTVEHTQARVIMESVNIYGMAYE